MIKNMSKRLYISIFFMKGVESGTYCFYFEEVFANGYTFEGL